MVTSYGISELIDRAKKNKLSNPDPTASAFATWVYKLSHNFPLNSSQTISDPIPRKSKSEPFLESDIPLIAKYIATNRNDLKYQAGWRLFYADNGSGIDESFIASELKVNDRPLKCKPDAVLIHDPTDEILILERKIMRPYKLQEQVPETSYPNIRAQLWCYSKIDQWCGAARITLMDEIWRRNLVCPENLTAPKVRRFWGHRDYLITQFQELFELY